MFVSILAAFFHLMSHSFQIPSLPKTGLKQKWGHCPGSVLSLAIIETAKSHPAPVLVVTKDTPTAIRLGYECRFYSNAGQDVDILNFPDWETLAYDHFSPHQDIISQRLLTLFKLQDLKTGILIVPISTLMQRIAPLEYVNSHTFILKKGDQLPIQSVRQKLEAGGYRAVSEVREHGEYVARGSVFDLFPMGSQVPYRIDLWDDEVDSIRTFDPDTQRSLEKVEDIQVLPAKEFPMTEEAITHFRQTWRSTFGGNPANHNIYQDVSDGLTPAGIEYYLPFFFEEMAHLCDYLPESTLIFSETGNDQAAEHSWQEIQERYEQFRYDTSRPILAPEALCLDAPSLYQRIKPFARVQFQLEQGLKTEEKGALDAVPPPLLPIQSQSKQPLSHLKDWIEESPNRILFAVETSGRREILLSLLHKANIHPHTYDSWPAFLDSDDNLGIIVAPMDHGLVAPEFGIEIIVESQLFGEKVQQRRARKSKDMGDAVIRHLAELNIGDPVVHIDAGVGRYQGLQHLTVGGQETEFVTLAYAGEDKLYVPVSSLHLISRYTGGDADSAPVHKLGGDKWSKEKEKAAKRARDVAAELLNIYARREAQQGRVYEVNEEDYRLFSESFPFEETPDQEAAIEAVLDDLCNTKPMDRLVCGDVGFGKTEVAMRAAFVVVQNNKQVVVLVPTTLLAQQHYESFCDRFADWPVNIELLSRFRTQKQQSQVMDKLSSGKVDILISTHKLLHQDIDFKDLGLLIVDEEHRFGVRQKDKMKSLKSQVDILTLTATPIPRTLNMSMSGIRDISIIATPPSKRLSIKTFVRERNKALIREAILREIHRGGQVYCLHNDVESIERVKEEIQEIVPEARYGVAHGQMRERELERVMSDFYHQRFNVLVCTTIIETGIDIPTANTIIIFRSDRFGLSQLHQLRGRVGRSHHQAYAYLFTPSKKLLTKDAQKRLEAIAAFEDLGAGFMLATHDLEIRGAGEFLGKEQSGHVQAIGFSLYMRLLEKAVEGLKSGKELNLESPLEPNTEINLGSSALIPDDYIIDVHTRLVMYKRIANATSEESLDELKVEFIDRFGLLPTPLKHLFDLTSLKFQAEPMGIQKITLSDSGGRIDFEESPKIDTNKLIGLIQRQPQHFKLEGPKRLKVEKPMKDFEGRVTFLEGLFETLQPDPTNDEQTH